MRRHECRHRTRVRWRLEKDGQAIYTGPPELSYEYILVSFSFHKRRSRHIGSGSGLVHGYPIYYLYLSSLINRYTGNRSFLEVVYTIGFVSCGGWGMS